MSSRYEQQKMIQNEVMFRQYNQRVQQGFNELVTTAKEDRQTELLQNIDDKIHFYCECADENCTERIVIKPSTYEKIHSNAKRFIVKPGHIVLEIEKCIRKMATYDVIEKHVTPPKTAPGLQHTNVSN